MSLASSPLPFFSLLPTRTKYDGVEKFELETRIIRCSQTKICCLWSEAGIALPSLFISLLLTLFLCMHVFACAHDFTMTSKIQISFYYFYYDDIDIPWIVPKSKLEVVHKLACKWDIFRNTCVHLHGCRGKTDLQPIICGINLWWPSKRYSLSLLALFIRNLSAFEPCISAINSSRSLLNHWQA